MENGSIPSLMPQTLDIYLIASSGEEKEPHKITFDAATTSTRALDLTDENSSSNALRRPVLVTLYNFIPSGSSTSTAILTMLRNAKLQRNPRLRKVRSQMAPLDRDDKLRQIVQFETSRWIGQE
jgi:hypothetical protein